MKNKVELNFFLMIREFYIYNVKIYLMKIEVFILFLCVYCVISDRMNMVIMLLIFYLKILKMIF